MPELIFDTKENNNRRREKEFLALSPGERVMVFLKTSAEFAKFGTKTKPKNKRNFILKKGQNGI